MLGPGKIFVEYMLDDECTTSSSHFFQEASGLTRPFHPDARGGIPVVASHLLRHEAGGVRSGIITHVGRFQRERELGF